MNRNLKVKAGIIVALILVCVYGIIGIPRSGAELMSNWKSNIHLGLDLKGGTHLVLQVQLQDAFMADAESVIDRLKQEFGKQTIAYADMSRNDLARLEDADKIQILIKGVPAERTKDVRSIASDDLPDWILTPINSTDYRLTMKPSSALKLKEDTLNQTMQTIERKINGLGLAESSVQKRGRAEAEAELLVSLPGVDDPARIKALLQEQAMLELYEVKDGPFASREEALGKHGGILPFNTKIVPSVPRRGQEQGSYLLARIPVVRGADLRDSRPSQDSQTGAWETSFVLTQDAANRFGRFTEANINNRLAIVLDGKVLEAPTIQAKITDSGRITGAANQQEASDLALNLRAGSLPARVIPEEERTVGPSLGADSIRSGLLAGGVGLLAVVFFMLVYYCGSRANAVVVIANAVVLIFAWGCFHASLFVPGFEYAFWPASLGLMAVLLLMLIYYRGAGLNATLALILNAVILIATLAYFDATLTLPGIAGVILTIGMAVDSNVLIFERIREELRTGKGVVAAVDTGFSRAFLTIIDTHVTTVVSCAFLFLFGTGPVKGFAVTLVIGLIANVFTAVFVSKTIFDWEFSRKRVATISI